MIYSFSLETALSVVGLLLLFGHLAALLRTSFLQNALRAFPRSPTAGFILFVLAAVWFTGLVAFTDLGEFSSMRPKFLLFAVAGAVLTLRFVREFLAVRALGMLLLLVGEPLLEAAWMRPETGKLWLVGLVYGWITAGLFLIGMPYLLRDAIAWVTAAPIRWKAASMAGMGYGVVLLAVRASF